MCGHIIPFQGGRVPSLPFFFLAVMGIQASLHTLTKSPLWFGGKQAIYAGIRKLAKRKALKAWPREVIKFQTKIFVKGELSKSELDNSQEEKLLKPDPKKLSKFRLKNISEFTTYSY